MSESDRNEAQRQILGKAAELPAAPGVYLFKDAEGRVLYIGKAANLRSRVSSYLQPGANLSASRGPRIDRMAREAADVDYIECESEVDALLRESRLIKDVQPPYNAQLRDEKTYPYLQVTTREDFPRVGITREPKSKNARLYGPFVSVADLRAALPLLQRVFKFRTCNLDISEGDESRRHFRPCILHSIKQCTAPCAARVGKDDYARQIRSFRQFLESKGTQLRRVLQKQMREAAEALEYERAAELRDELRALDGLQKRGLVDEHVQPEAFFIDPGEGLQRLADVLGLSRQPRIIEAIDVAHLAGGESCGSLVCFIDGKPLKSAYRRYKIKSHDRNDDYASIREVVWRRYKAAGMAEEVFPDIVLIDGGPGQLSAAHEAFEPLELAPPVLASLAKQEEVVYVLGRDEPLRLPRRDPGLRILQSVRDEAHRFAQHYHHILRRRATLQRDEPVRKRGRGPKKR